MVSIKVGTENQTDISSAARLFNGGVRDLSNPTSLMFSNLSTFGGPLTTLNSRTMVYMEMGPLSFSSF